MEARALVGGEGGGLESELRWFSILHLDFSIGVGLLEQVMGL